MEFGRWGDVVVPTRRGPGYIDPGRAGAGGGSSRQFDRVHENQLAMPLEPFRDPGQVRPTPVEKGLTGKLIDARDPHSIAGAQQYFFIDKGRRDGVTLGDVFEVYKPAQGYAETASEEVRAVLMIVHTRERSRDRSASTDQSSEPGPSPSGTVDQEDALLKGGRAQLRGTGSYLP